MTTKSNHFCDILGHSTIQELCAHALHFGQKTPQEYHVVRSCILELHAALEGMLKHILYQHMLLLIENMEEYHDENETMIAALADNISRMSYGALLQLLHPCLKAWDGKTMAPLTEINKVRNAVAHNKPQNTLYKRRNPFTNPDALAEFIHDAETAFSEMGELSFQRFGFCHPKTISRIK